MTSDQKTASSSKELRQFGFMMAAVVAGLFGLLLPWVWGIEKFPSWPWIVALIFVTPALLLPRLLAPVFAIWMKIAHVLGWINTRLILSLVYYLMICPIGIVFKIMGKDALARRTSTSLQSYRKKSKVRPNNSKNLKRPF